ncbi:MAG: hypothetical protein RIQ52_1689 [Pseudomonadota bacterium]
MFTGIIQSKGHIVDLETRGGDCRIHIATGKLPLGDARLGDSIAVNGVCLTAVVLGDASFRADVSRETLSRTTLGQLKKGSIVNLEQALLPTTRMGGHIVSGHVDGVGRVVRREQDARSVRFAIEVPAHLGKYIAEKGSVCVDGISLTVNGVQDAVFDINIVPHTLEETTLGSTEPGQLVNIEVDLLARYLERLLTGGMAGHQEQQSRIGLETLAAAGFLDGHQH